jgi:RNA-directed DNA polymerase
LVRLAENDNPLKTLKFQRELTLSLSFRLVAVNKVISSEYTPYMELTGGRRGVDGDKITKSVLKIGLVEKLKDYIINYKDYKAYPVKIPKANGKLRPLGIPTIQDRCLQSLITLSLEPLVERTSDCDSYGFRKYRNAKMAIGALRYQLISSPTRYKEATYNKFVLDAEIKGFFDHINHE